jgi:arginine decarboxylase
MKITITTGTGEGPTPLAAFDKALLDAGVANYNLIYLSSIIPPNSVIERAHYMTPPDEYGHRLYVVVARQSTEEPGTSAWAGIGWTQDCASGKGLFVELHGGSQCEVEQSIDQTLTSMIASRSSSYGLINCEVVGKTCADKPVCALVMAIYKSEGWDD